MQERELSKDELKLVNMEVLDGNKLAAGRSLMAWVRTCLSMIGSGFLCLCVVPVHCGAGKRSCSEISGPA